MGAMIPAHVALVEYNLPTALPLIGDRWNDNLEHHQSGPICFRLTPRPKHAHRTSPAGHAVRAARHRRGAQGLLRGSNGFAAVKKAVVDAAGH